MKIIIPMSGLGKRFVDAGYKDPKPLIVVEGKPIIQHIVELFPGETDFHFVCNDMHLRETNMREVLEKICPTGKIYEVDVNHKKGPVYAVMQIANTIRDDDEIIVSYCDYGTLWDYETFKKEVRENGADGAIPCYIGFHPHMLGSDNYAFVRENNKWMIEIQEKKPFTENKMNEYASNGTYYFRTGSILKKYFQELMDKDLNLKGEYYVSMVYNLLQNDGLKTYIFEIKKMLQWGTPKDLEEYLIWSNYFLQRKDNFQHEYDSSKNLFSGKDTTLILPMAGAGSRFFTQGYTTPKPLLDIEGKPMIVQAVDCLPPSDKKIFICQNSHLNEYKIGEVLQEHFENTEIIGIDYITEGQACTCELAFKYSQIDLEKPLLISACDNGVYYDMSEYVKLVEDPDVDFIIWSFSNNSTSKLYPHMYAWLDVDENNYIKRVSIKKPFDDVPNKYAIIGTMYFKKAKYFLEGLDLIYTTNYRTNGEFYVDNMIEPLITEKGYKAKIFDVKNYLCWGTPNDYKTYNYWKEFFIDIKKNKI